MRRRNLVCVLLGCVLLYGRVKGYVYMNDLCFSILHVCLSFKTSTSTKMVFIVVTSAQGLSPQPTACRSPTFSLMNTTGINQALGKVSTYFAQESEGAIRCQLIFVSWFSCTPHGDLAYLAFITSNHYIIRVWMRLDFASEMNTNSFKLFTINGILQQSFDLGSFSFSLQIITIKTNQTSVVSQIRTING